MKPKPPIQLSHPQKYGCGPEKVDPDRWDTYVRDPSTGIFMPIYREKNSCACGECPEREVV